MKKLLGIVVLSLLLSFNANADDIKDFQIEGISIGDSLLKYYSEAEIKKALKDGYYYKDNKFVDVFFYPKSDSIYDDLQITIKPKDDSYKIYVMAAKILYKKAVASAVDKIFTRLLASKILVIKSPFLFINLSTNFALLSPCLAFDSMRAFDTAVIAVSEPEKKPETKIKTIINSK